MTPSDIFSFLLLCWEVSFGPVLGGFYAKLGLMYTRSRGVRGLLFFSMEILDRSNKNAI